MNKEEMTRGIRAASKEIIAAHEPEEIVNQLVAIAAIKFTYEYLKALDVLDEK